MQRFILTLSILVLVSCAGIKDFHLETTPNEANVFLYDASQKKYIEVGKTPFKLTNEKLKEYIKGGNSFVALRVEKAGHAVEHIIYDTKTKKKVEYFLQLKAIEMWADKEGSISSKLANDIAKKVQSINRAIVQKELDQALVRTNNLIELYPKAYVFYDIKGSIHLLKGNKAQAISSLKKSLSINPDNVETENILKALDKGGVI